MNPPFKVSLLKKIASYFYPVTVTQGYDEGETLLRVLLYNNTWQLAAVTALYSDGRRYRPFKVAFKAIGGSRLLSAENCLVLGTGLGSIPQILQHDYDLTLHFDLVEKDSRIAEWVVGLLPSLGVNDISVYCTDALDYMLQNTKKYSLLCVDIFNDRSVPDVFTTIDFLQYCRQAILPAGFFVMNYIVEEEQSWQRLQEHVKLVFPKVNMLHNDINRILIAEI